MRKRTICALGVALALAVAVPEAQAVTIHGTQLTGPSTHKAELREYLGKSILPTPPRAVLHDGIGPCREGRGCAMRPDQIWVRRGTSPWVFMHEIGHLVDFQLMDEDDHQAFIELAGSTNPWTGGGSGGALNSPFECFPSAYATVAIRPHGSPPRGVISDCLVAVLNRKAAFKRFVRGLFEPGGTQP
jgi:hypothetical protein